MLLQILYIGKRNIRYVSDTDTCVVLVKCIRGLSHNLKSFWLTDTSQQYAHAYPCMDLNILLFFHVLIIVLLTFNFL